MWLEDEVRKKAVFHVVDIDTGYSNANFLRGQTIEDVLLAFLECWPTTYLGYPASMKVEKGPQFTAERWKRTEALPILLNAVAQRQTAGGGGGEADFLKAGGGRV